MQMAVVQHEIEWESPEQNFAALRSQIDEAAAILGGHLGALHAAMEEGADVRGYYYWSWVDNYEWNHGFDLRFGLNGLEADKSRTPRPVFERYQQIIAAGGLD